MFVVCPSILDPQTQLRHARWWGRSVAQQQQSHSYQQYSRHITHRSTPCQVREDHRNSPLKRISSCNPDHPLGIASAATFKRLFRLPPSSFLASYNSSHSTGPQSTDRMAPLNVGDKFPDGVKFDYVPVTDPDPTTCGVPQEYDASKEFAGKKVVIVSVPGMLSF